MEDEVDILSKMSWVTAGSLGLSEASQGNRGGGTVARDEMMNILLNTQS